MSTSLRPAYDADALPAERASASERTRPEPGAALGSELDPVRAVIAGEALTPVGDHVDLSPYLSWIEATYGEELVGVVFYGSCLSASTQRSTSTPDFFVVTDTGRIPAHTRRTRALHRFVPPNSQTGVLRGEGEDADQLFKYIHLDLGQLVAATAESCPDLFVAGRLSKRVRLVHWRDDAAREALLDALGAAVRTLAPIVWAKLPGVFDLDELVTASVAVSYLSEWRVEAAGKIDSLLSSAPEYYQQLYAAILDEHLSQGRVVRTADGRYRSLAGPDDAKLARRRLSRSRRRGALRWPKYLLTVRGAPQLMLGKLQRAHPDVRVGRFGRRFPLLYAVPFMLRLLWRGALKTHAPAASAAPLEATEAEPWERSFALVANASSRRNRDGQFDPAPFRQALGERGVVRLSTCPADVPGIVDELCDRGVEAIFVLGGDGTLGSVVTEVIHRWKGPLPAFVPLRGGALNNTAKAFGASRDAVDDVRRVVDGRHEERVLRPLRVTDPARRERDVFGFVFGAGLVYEYARHIEKRGGSTWWNTASESVALTAAGYFGTRRGREVWRPLKADVSLDERDLPHDDFMAVSATAVIAQPFLLHPYPDPQPVEAETMTYLVNAMTKGGIVRHTVGILRGSCRAPGHYRGHAGHLRVLSDAGYMLDGELHERHETPVEFVVSTGPAVRFLTASAGKR